MKNFIIENSILLYLSVPVYWLVWRDLLKMGMDSHVQKVLGKPPEIFPTGYFFWLMIQIFPLILAGIAREDTFVMATRLPLLLFVIICYVMVTNKDGIFEWSKYGNKIILTAIVVSLFFVGYKQFPEIETFLKKNSELFGYIAFLSMVAYIVFGEVTTIKKSYTNLKCGNVRMRGWHLLLFRFVGYCLQTGHYELKFGCSDPFFLVNALGLIGTGTMIVLYYKTPIALLHVKDSF